MGACMPRRGRRDTSRWGAWGQAGLGGVGGILPGGGLWGHASLGGVVRHAGLRGEGGMQVRLWSFQTRHFHVGGWVGVVDRFWSFQTRYFQVEWWASTHPDAPRSAPACPPDYAPAAPPHYHPGQVRQPGCHSHQLRAVPNTHAQLLCGATPGVCGREWGAE